jgi:hypothetical protein
VAGIPDYKHASIIEIHYPIFLDGKFLGLEASMVMSQDNDRQSKD